MIKYILSILSLLVSLNLYADTDSFPTTSLAGFSGLPCTLVNDCVSVITGEFIDVQTDAILPGPEPLILRRSYSSSNQSSDRLLKNGWYFNLGLYAYLEKTSREDPNKPHDYLAHIREDSGVVLDYRGKRQGHDNFSLKLKKAEKGFTNCVGAEISARTNLQNQSVNIDKKLNTAKLYSSDGTTRYFDLEDQARGKQNSARAYLLLTRESTSGGNLIEYEYENNKTPLKIIAKDSKSQFEYSALKFSPIKPNYLAVLTSQKKTIEYTLHWHTGHEHDGYYLTEVKRPDRPQENFDYYFAEWPDNPLMKRKARPDDRYVDIEYYQDGKVRALYEPAGNSGERICTYHFVYQKDATEVANANNQKTIYRYDENCRLTALEKFKGNTLYSAEKYIWGKDTGNLLGSYLQDESGKNISGRFFEYDLKGNITKEKLYGQLTGTSQKTFEIVNEKPNGGENYDKMFTYSEDKFHLLLSESEGNRTIQYSYVPNTDRIQSKFLLGQNTIKMRQFYEYDENIGVVTSVILDDGCSQNVGDLTGVTERHITRMTHNMIEPIGLPKEVEELFWDIEKKQEVLLKRTSFKYTPEGKIYQKDTYYPSEENSLCEEWKYDEHGNVTEEINALGEKIVRAYDSNDNLIYESIPFKEIKNIPNPKVIHKAYTYDKMNHILEIAEKNSNDESLSTTHYSYNSLGQCTQEMDRFGNLTEHQYDEQGRIKSSIGPENRTLSKEYDILNNPTEVIDGLGRKTTTTYTARGQPILITHPDGTQEKFEYTLNGSLKKKTAPNGSYTTYEYDYLDRITSEIIYSSNNEKLNEIHSEYNAFHLTSTTENNLKTSYTYDYAGRLDSLTSEHKARNKDKNVDQQVRVTQFAYDSHGRKNKEIYLCDDKQTIKSFKYDDLDRVIEEIVSDQKGEEFSKIKYEYDYQGNISRETIAGKDYHSSTATEYNYLGQPTKITDALDNTTNITYDNNDHSITIQDPLGNFTITTYDAYNQATGIVRKDAMGTETAWQEINYDAAGNRTKVINTVFVDNKPTHSQITEWQYNAADQVTLQIEPGNKRTSYEYNSYGQIKCIIKPDGTKIQHEYDSLGRLNNYYASDNSFSYKYTYNTDNRLSEIIDHSSNITKRDYNLFGDIISETLANGITISYAYDSLGRMTEMTLPDNSKVNYTYNAAHLKTISRIGVDKSTLYTHQYEKYDPSGTVTQSRLCGSAGTLEIKSDLLQRPVKISSATWNQSAQYKAKNLTQKITNVATGKSTCDYTYDALNQLTSETAPNHTYRFDSLENRIEKDSIPAIINTQNQLTQHSNCTYEYDLNGNLTKKLDGNQITEYRYDALDRLIEVNHEGISTTYQYDAFNRRYAKNKDQYIYQGQNEIGTIRNGEIIELRILGLGRGAEIGAAVALELSGNTYVPLHDIHGNVATILDTFGSTQEIYHYSAFGEEQIFDESGNQKERSINPWRYASKRYDPETGFIYFGRRYYASDIGRWITPDPVGYDDGPNLYAYVHNNPLTKFDLFGLRVGDAYRESRHVAEQAPHYARREPSKDRRTTSENRYIVKKNFATGLSEIVIPIRSRDLSIENLMDMYDDEFFDRKLVFHYQGYAAGVTTGAAILATGAVICEFGAFVSVANSARVACLTRIVRYVNTGRSFYNIFSRRNRLSTQSQEFSPPISTSVETTKTCTRNQIRNNIEELEEQINTWLGQGTNLKKNESGDLVFISQDGMKRVRFDFNRPAPHQNPHAHIEELIKGTWKKSGPIFPVDVPPI